MQKMLDEQVKTIAELKSGKAQLEAEHQRVLQAHNQQREQVRRLKQLALEIVDEPPPASLPHSHLSPSEYVSGANSAHATGPAQLPQRPLGMPMGARPVPVKVTGAPVMPPTRSAGPVQSAQKAQEAKSTTDPPPEVLGTTSGTDPEVQLPSVDSLLVATERFELEAQHMELQSMKQQLLLEQYILTRSTDEVVTHPAAPLPTVDCLPDDGRWKMEADHMKLQAERAKLIQELIGLASSCGVGSKSPADGSLSPVSRASPLNSSGRGE